MSMIADHQRSISLPAKCFYKVSLPQSAAMPGQKQKSTERTNKPNINVSRETNVTAKKRKLSNEENGQRDGTQRVSSRLKAKKSTKSLQVEEVQESKVKAEPKEEPKLEQVISSEMSDYEAKRLKNIEENAKFFASLGIFEAKDDLVASTGSKKKKVTRGLKPDRPKPAPVQRRAPSLRLQGKKPDGTEIPGFEGFQTSLYQYEASDDRREEQRRHPEGPRDMECTNVKKETKEEGAEFIQNIVKLSRKIKNEEPEHEEIGADAASLLKTLQSLKISERRVAKVVPDRIFSVGFHPSPERTVVAAGDKWGCLGFWDLDSSDGDDGVFLFLPHTRPVNCLSFSPSQPSKVFTCSYDGTLRCGDFERGIFDELYATDEENYSSWIHYFTFLDRGGRNILIAQNEGRGHITTIDTRSPGRIGEKICKLHDKNIRTVSVHPLQPQYFITASIDCHIALWDVRKLNYSGANKSICQLPHGKGLNSAYFSPITGSKILSTCADDTLRIYRPEDTDGALKDISLASKKYHNNHTGRWLTKFRAEWHPRCEEIFIVGSMARPRQIELFSDKLQLLHTYRSEEWLGSVCSLNTFHPTRDIIAGGNSSGRMHVFM